MADKNRVLFFDDDPFISKTLVDTLELLGWDVTLISEIDDLFIKLNSILQFDVIILDIMAPIPQADSGYVKFTKKEINEMNDGLNTGVVATKKIWQMEKYKNTPILFLSIAKDPRFENPELQNDKCDYLRKPEKARTIGERLINLLNI